MFEVTSYRKRFDANKVTVLETGGHPYVVRTGINNGQKGFIEEDEIFLNDANTISFGQDTATMFYQEKPYFTGDKIKILIPKDGRFGKKNAQFFLAAMRKTFSCFSWGNSRFHAKHIQDQIIRLPIKNGDIDFGFMEHFITELQINSVRELEIEHLAELNAYLKVAHLKEYKLTSEESEIIGGGVNICSSTKEFSFCSIFDHIQQGRRLKKEDQRPGDIPFVMSGTTNVGVVNFISNPVALFPENAITIDIFGNSFYRSYAFGAGDDTGVYWNESSPYTREVMLFLAAAMQCAVKDKFSYGKKLRSSQSLDFKMVLPTKDGVPDFTYMKTLIRSVQKLVIQDVVRYSARQFTAAKSVIQT